MTTSIPLSDLESSPAAKWNAIGDRCAGRIKSMVERQQTDPDRKLLAFDDGTPRMQWIITIETTDGSDVALYAKGGNYKAASGEGESMLKAIGLAVREAGADGVDVGGTLDVIHTGLGEKKAGYSAPRLFRAKYAPPAPPSVPVDDLFGS